MTPPPSPASSSAATPSAPSLPPLGVLAAKRLWPLAVGTAAAGLTLDGLERLAPGSLLSTAAAAAGLGLLWWLRPARHRPSPPAPTTVDGWLQRLEALQAQFERLEQEQQPVGTHPAPACQRRDAQLSALRAQLQRPGLHLAVVGRPPLDPSWRQRFSLALQGSQPLTLHWSSPLPAASGSWHWPEPFASCDALVFCLCTPLMASDLRWLEALPGGQPLWLLLNLGPDGDGPAARSELLSQLQLQPAPTVLCWDGIEAPQAALRPLAHSCAAEAARLRSDRQLRCLEDLHSRWQAELEGLRRVRFQVIQQRTQWLVAAGVVAAPLPSLDLLVLAVANGLMVREMAQLWDCPWSGEQLRALAVELARASLTLGVVEWSTQALAGAVKWHGATWLLGSVVQALSAAYLTRVVGSAMADTLARSVGVREPDLERIRREAPLLVARAAERERIDWSAFVRQGQQWLTEQAGNLPPAGNTSQQSA